MAGEIKAALSKPAAAQKFTATFVDGYLTPAFGARSKSEIDLLVFTCLVEAKAIDPDGPIFDIARALNITPARARNLVLNWQLRTTSAPGDLRQAFANAIRKTRFSKDGTLLTFGVESPLLREEIAATLRRRGFFVDRSFTSEIMRIPVDWLVEFLDEIVDEKTKEEVQSSLVKDKQLPDTSFKALATGVLTKLGEKIAGEVAGELAKKTVGGVSDFAKPYTDKAINFMSGMLFGNAKAATKGIGKDDYVEV